MPDRPKVDVLLSPYRETWGWIFKGLAFNAVASLSMVGLLALLGKFESIEQFNAEGLTTRAYFNSLSFANFWLFFKQHLAMGPIAEEMFWRFPVFILIKLEIKRFFQNPRWAECILWSSLVIPTWFWALGHTPLVLPIFVTGLTYGWLLIKTKPAWPWPAIVCHSLSNFAIYFLVKILQFTDHAPIN